MSCNERTALLATQTQQGQLNPQQREQQQQQHIIAMPTGKAAKDYEPIYTTADLDESGKTAVYVSSYSSS
ncbi:uncharacterized protein LOC108602107 isoform X2 [Drosophila busckii]|uniref:uncharacterized protein LOC108602107 isoform X2 n=1 Tax=Drosophila busckii TaxID=30019 RepID=UPI00083E9D0C|nr:uncharacterized protein LOC108602107 isoform X2 [Drosophila busckii]